MNGGIGFGELPQYEERETKRWKEWFAAHPEALERRCDVASAGTVRRRPLQKNRKCRAYGARDCFCLVTQRLRVCVATRA